MAAWLQTPVRLGSPKDRKGYETRNPQKLENEWKYLVVANETWSWLRANPEVSEKGVALHTEVMVMDAAYLHGRNLYEFFGMVEDKGAASIRSATVRDFGVEAQGLSSVWLPIWRHALNGRLFHFRLARTTIVDKAGTQQSSQINREVSNMTTDLLSIWDQFLSLVADSSVRIELTTAMSKARRDLDTGDIVVRFQEMEDRLG